METNENTHSRKVRKILFNQSEFAVSRRWNLTGWITMLNRVEFVIQTKKFHGVICVETFEENKCYFLVGSSDFNTNGTVNWKVVSQNELFDFIDNLRGYEAPHSPSKDYFTIPNDGKCVTQ